METRVKGFVVGENQRGSSSYWVVRVNDQNSPFYGKKLDVLSTHDNITLGRGLDVNFIIGTTDGHSGEKVHKAVDVNVD